MVRKIVKYGDPVLEQECAPVSEFNSPELRRLVDDMFETMYAAKGVGLAAPQVGVPQQVAVIDVSLGERAEDKLVIINPRIGEREGTQVEEEGCLSIPGFREPVTRARRVTFRFRDVEGSEREMSGEDLLARAVLHETDHLHGVLFINYLSALKRDLIRRKIRKLQKAGEWE